MLAAGVLFALLAGFAAYDFCTPEPTNGTAWMDTGYGLYPVSLDFVFNDPSVPDMHEWVQETFIPGKHEIFENKPSGDYLTDEAEPDPGEIYSQFTYHIVNYGYDFDESERITSFAVGLNTGNSHRLHRQGLTLL
jgi:hypothetical protein